MDKAKKPGDAVLDTTVRSLHVPVGLLRLSLRVELSLSYGRRSVDKFVLVWGSPLGPMTRFYPYPSFSGNCFVVVPVWRPL
jgi:hypothetical protein